MPAFANILLVGPMGAGKTSHGKWLARQLGQRFIDLDALIEQNTGASITDIFDKEGEAGFRKRESQTLAHVLSEHDQVLSTGGGAVLSEANRQLMRERGLIIHLHITPEQQLQRLANDRKRPLLQGSNRAERLQQLAEIRTPIYRACADISLDLSQVPMSRVRPLLLHAIQDRLNITESDHADH